MKLAVFALVPALLLGAVPAAAQDQTPRGAISLQGGGTLAAPAGVELELFDGSMGAVLESRLFVSKRRGDWVVVLEPGACFRFYFDGVDRSLFYFVGAGFLTIVSFQPLFVEQGIVKFRTGMGYNLLLGRGSRWRLGAEIGAAWLQEVIKGEHFDILFPAVPHLLLVCGKTF